MAAIATRGQACYGLTLIHAHKHTLTKYSRIQRANFARLSDNPIETETSNLSQWVKTILIWTC